jgi:hypothetical protein
MSKNGGPVEAAVEALRASQAEPEVLHILFSKCDN